MADVRPRIIAQYAEWTALSALRSGAPIKSRRDVYTALSLVEFDKLFDLAIGPITSGAFDIWHKRAVADLCARDDRLTVGWAAKILNVYLKTRCYVGAQGRPGLADAVHPPIDGGLWVGLQRKFAHRPDILERSNCVRRIKDITDYACYERIIEGCRAAAQELGCRLIEIEQLWTGTEYDKTQTDKSAPARALPG